MENNKVLGGIILIGIGLVFLLMNMDIVSGAILWNLFNLWPLILIVVGINIIFKNNRIISVITWILFFAVLIGYGIIKTEDQDKRFSSSETNVHMDKLEQTEIGELRLMLGGANVEVYAADGSSLLEGHFTGWPVKRRLAYRDGKKIASIELRNEEIQWNRNKNNRYQIGLNKQMIWSIDADMGAINGTIDLSDVKIDDFELNVGAGNLHLIFGDQYQQTNVDIDAGATALDISIPKNIGVRLHSRGGISTTNLQGQGWIKQNKYYTSSNYEAAEKKIDLDITMGVGKVNVALD